MTKFLALFSIFLALPATAQQALETVGKPIPGGFGFQPAATELARDLQFLDWLILVIITAITIFVTGLIIYIIFRFSRKNNPIPAKFTHHTPIEIAWTIVPIVILVFIGSFSLPVLFKSQEIPEADITIKVTGYQWYWGYEYVDHGFDFDSFMLDAAYEIDDEANGWGPDQPMGTPGIRGEIANAKLEYFGYAPDEFLLATDTAIVIPVNKVVVMQLTGADVIHSWAMPAFGVKQDAVPGRLSQLWFSAEREGIYFGQCSELCGKSHAYMPITVKVVSQEVYDAWLKGAIEDEQYTILPESMKVASN
ncbi:MAG: cytochrome c oxidase subunit II [Rhodobacterales bacterium]|nr:cytochrome c oxidase subunit II [Rhodobacterales bacterium]